VYNDFYDIEDIFDFYDNETPWTEDVYDEEWVSENELFFDPEELGEGSFWYKFLLVFQR
jgi:hypothetical protein